MAKKYAHVNDVNGSEGNGLQIADILYSATLTSGGGDTTLTVPAAGSLGGIGGQLHNKWAAKIVTEQGSTVWHALNATAAVPAGATFAASTSELIPPETEIIRRVEAGDVMHFVTADATADVSVTFYSLNQ